jgi:hypothetical protein
MTPKYGSYLLLCFCLICYSQLFSQVNEWRLFPENSQNLYRLDSVFHPFSQPHRYLVYPIGVDSTLSNSAFNTHYLNHKIPFTNVKGDIAWFYDQYRKQDTHGGRGYFPEGGVVRDFLKVHPNYYKSIQYRLQDKAVLIDNQFIFYPYANVGDRWTSILPNKDTIQFTCTAKIQDKLSPFIHQSDSIRVFECLSRYGTVEMKLSKHYGFIQWYPYLLDMTDQFNQHLFIHSDNDTKKQQLLPLSWIGNRSSNQSIGYQLPRSNEFEQLPQVGDIRVWRNSDGDFYGRSFHRSIDSDSVTRVEKKPNGYLIHYHIIQKTTIKEYDSDKVTYTVKEKNKIVSFPTIWMRVIDAYPLIGYLHTGRGYDNDTYTPYYYATYLNNKWHTRVEMNYFYLDFQQDSSLDFEAGSTCHAYYTSKLNTSLGFYNVDYSGMSSGMDSTLIGGRNGGLNPQTMTTWGKLYPFNKDVITSRSPSEMATAGSILVYPNPTQELIYIQHPYPNQVSYQIYDSIGRIVQSGTATSNEAIPLNELPSGNYLIQTRYQDEVYGYRLVKY